MITADHNVGTRLPMVMYINLNKYYKGQVERWDGSTQPFEIAAT